MKFDLAGNWRGYRWMVWATVALTAVSLSVGMLIGLDLSTKQLKEATKQLKEATKQPPHVAPPPAVVTPVDPKETLAEHVEAVGDLEALLKVLCERSLVVLKEGTEDAEMPAIATKMKVIVDFLNSHQEKPRCYFHGIPWVRSDELDKPAKSESEDKP